MALSAKKKDLPSGERSLSMLYFPEKKALRLQAATIFPDITIVSENSLFYNEWEFGMSNEQLVYEIRQGRNVPENLNQLYLQNEVMLRKTAEGFRWSGEPVEDLVQSGWIGLQKAVDRYDPEGGASFLTYSLFWVRQEIRRYIENSGHLVRLPSFRQEQIYQYQRFLREYQTQHGTEPGPDLICRELKVSRKQLENIIEAVRLHEVDSLEKPVPGAEDLTLSDTLEGPQNVSEEVADKVLSEDIQSRIWAILEALQESQRAALIGTVMDARTLEDVGRDLGVNANRVAQLRTQAIKTIRKSRSFRRLEEDYSDLYGLALRGSGLASFRNTGTSSTEAAALRLIENEEELDRKLESLKDQSFLKTWIIKLHLQRSDRPTAEAIIRELVSDSKLQGILIRVILNGEKVPDLRDADLTRYRKAVAELHRTLANIASERAKNGPKSSDE